MKAATQAVDSIQAHKVLTAFKALITTAAAEGCGGVVPNAKANTFICP